MIDPEPDGTTSLEALEEEICALASHIHAATCRWLSLVAEFDRRQGWASWGARSCAHWVAWRCGIAPVSAREHVRVARRLADLPAVRAAFARGELSYSKVRAITRVDGLERETDLLSLAQHATAAQLERLVRAHRSVVAVERVAQGARAERWLTWDHDDDGSLLLRGRLPAEEGAVLIAALEAARERLAAASAEAGEAAGHNERGACAEADEAAGHNERGASAEAGKAAGDGERGASAEAGDAAGDDERDARANAGEAAAAGERGAAAEARDDDPGTLEDARDASAEALATTAGEARADALMLMAETMLAGSHGARTGGDRYQVVVHVDTATLRGDERGETSELDDGVPLAAETARRLACDASIVRILERDGRPLSVGRKTRSIPPALRRALAARDRGCRFPGCTARHFVDAHHVEHWAQGGETSLSNLVQMCRHHHRLLHEGRYALEPGPDGRLIFRRPDGRRISDCPQAPRGHVGAIHARRVRADACVSLSHGERMDLDLGVDWMLTFAPPAPATAVAPGI
ncbi:MAG TPA: DUF222 domain-containing protein [Solirubrobacteraceae bacterium]